MGKPNSSFKMANKVFNMNNQVTVKTEKNKCL